MSKNILRAGSAAGTVVLSAGTGLATNLLTDQPSWGVGAAVVVLVIAGVALAVAISMLEQRGGPLPAAAPEPAAPGQSGFSQYAYSAGGRTTQAGRDVRTGMPAGYVVLCLLIVAAVVVTVLLVAVKLAPASGVNPTVVTSPAVVNSAAASASEDLSYQLTASPATSPTAPGNLRTVKVTAKASGQPEPGLTYWFMLEVNYGTGYIEYYPRRKMTGRSTAFDVTIPDDADTKFVRSGRIYGLNSAENAQAEDRLTRQGATGVNDFFDKPTGQPVSDAVKLPF
jgi:hypothetical protein